MTDAEDRISKAMDIVARYGQIEGCHHKTWVIDQVARALMGDKYPAFLKEMRGEVGEDGEWGYAWEEGVAP